MQYQSWKKNKFVLDKFHLWKYISAAASHLMDSTEDARELIYDAIREKDIWKKWRDFSENVGPMP